MGELIDNIARLLASRVRRRRAFGIIGGGLSATMLARLGLGVGSAHASSDADTGILVASVPAQNPKADRESGRQPADPAAVAAVSIFNNRLAIQVENTGAGTGRFNMGAFPNPSTGGAQAGSFDLLFRWPNPPGATVFPGTSYTTVRVDGQDAIFGGSSGQFLEQPTNVDSTTSRTRWQFGDIEVTQLLQIASNPQTGQVDIGRIAYTVRNTSQSASHEVGLRILMDVEINQNDNAPYRVPGVGPVTQETEFLGSAIPDSFQAFQDLNSNQFVAAAILRGGDSPPPDRLVFARWPQIAPQPFDYTISPGAPLGDSAYALFWNPSTLAPGQSRTYVTRYGLGAVTAASGDLAVGVSGPAALDLVNGQYSPNPFNVVATIQNTTSQTVSNVQATLNLPTGLSLASGSATQSAPTLAPNQEAQFTWSVQAAPQTTATTLTYSVAVTATGANPNTVSRQITLPAIPSTLGGTCRDFKSSEAKRCRRENGTSCPFACNNSSQCLSAQVRGGGTLCIRADTACKELQRCGSSQQCPSGQTCVINTCCKVKTKRGEEGVCIPSSGVCASSPIPAPRNRAPTASGSTVGG